MKNINMRSIKELLILLKNNTKVTNDKISFGLCAEVKTLFFNNKISLSEYFLLKDYIKRYMPKDRHDGYGWEVTLWPPRLEWLNKHITYEQK